LLVAGCYHFLLKYGDIPAKFNDHAGSVLIWPKIFMHFTAFFDTSKSPSGWMIIQLAKMLDKSHPIEVCLNLVVFNSIGSTL
jgi:hypothetical protein